jgi:hypothetical protein
MDFGIEVHFQLLIPEFPVSLQERNSSFIKLGFMRRSNRVGNCHATRGHWKKTIFRYLVCATVKHHKPRLQDFKLFTSKRAIAVSESDFVQC